MKKLFFFAFAGLLFTSCSDEYYYYELPPESNACTVDFEGAELGDIGYIWGKPLSKVLAEDDVEALYFGAGSLFWFDTLYAEADAGFLSLYSDYKGLYGSALDTWNGFVITNNTDMQTNDYSNDKSVYAASGANGSAQFAVLYYGAWTGKPYGVPTVKFVGGVKPQSVAVANTTLFYLYFKGETAPAAPVDVKGVITGYNCGNKTGKVEVTLADASGMVVADWETVDLSALGVVTSLEFTVETTDTRCPYYFAIDDLTYIK